MVVNLIIYRFKSISNFQHGNFPATFMNWFPTHCCDFCEHILKYWCDDWSAGLVIIASNDALFSCIDLVEFR